MSSQDKLLQLASQTISTLSQVIEDLKDQLTSERDKSRGLCDMLMKMSEPWAVPEELELESESELDEDTDSDDDYVVPVCTCGEGCDRMSDEDDEGDEGDDDNGDDLISLTDMH